MLALDEIWYKIHRTRAIKRDHRDDILEAVGTHIGSDFLHTFALYLKQSQRLAATDRLVGFGIVFIDLLPDDLFAESLFYELDGVIDHG